MQFLLQVFHYQLLGVIVHHGDRGAGHYIAFANHEEPWRMFDDKRVRLPSQVPCRCHLIGLLFPCICLQILKRRAICNSI